MRDFWKGQSLLKKSYFMDAVLARKTSKKFNRKCYTDETYLDYVSS